jgi:RND superfamily putative drug exporter
VSAASIDGMLTWLSRWPVRRPVVVVVLWLAVVAGSFTVGIGVFDRLVTDVGLVPGSESDRAYTMIADSGPQPVTLTAIARTTADHPAVASAVAELRTTPGVLSVAEPLPSTTAGPAVLLRVNVEPGPDSGAVATTVARRLARIGPGVVVAGGPLTDDEFNTQAQADVQRAELLTTPVVLALLLVVFGGIVAAGLPLLVAVAGVGGTFAVLYAASHVTDVSVYAIQVATMLSVGLAVDYGLLVVNRFREERTSDPDVTGAVTRTVATAGHTVLFSGLTVAAVLAGLLVFPDPFLRSMGLAGIGVTAVVVAAALTLLPALLALVGHRIRPATPAPADGGRFARLARAVQRRPLVTLLAAGGVMVVIALPALDLRLSQVDPRLLPTDTQTRRVHDATVSHFPALARPDPVVIVVAAPADSATVNDLRTRIAAVPHVTGVETGGTGPVTVLRAGLDVPAHSPAARHVVDTVRRLDPPVEVAVTGGTAMLVDYQRTITGHLPYAIVVIAVGTLILLFLFTGSVLLPVKAVATNLLSIGAALGAVVWVFQQGHLAGWFGTTGLSATHVSVPVLVAAIAFGLSIDYEVFLLSRIRERWLATGDNHTAVAQGLQGTGRIVTSAALLMCIVFAGFLTAGFVPIQSIGLGLTLAVALDAAIVRLLLVPATMTLAGRYNWWAPPPLRRLHARLSRRDNPQQPRPGIVGRYLSRQAAHPHGPTGRLIARIWIRETARVNDTAVDLLAVRPGQRIGEIGFGPGRTVGRLAAAGAEVVGLDVSSAMVTLASRRNASHISAGRVRLVQGDGTTLPVATGALDGLISVHSVYFWAEPTAVLAEIHRALRPGGRLVLAFRPGDLALPGRFDPAVYRVPTTADVTGWLAATGFTDVCVEQRPTMPTVVWITGAATAVEGRAPAAPRPSPARGRQRGTGQSSLEERAEHHVPHRHAGELVLEDLGQLQRHPGPAGDEVQDDGRDCGNQAGDGAYLPQRPPAQPTPATVRSHIGNHATQ